MNKIKLTKPKTQNEYFYSKFGSGKSCVMSDCGEYEYPISAIDIRKTYHLNDPQFWSDLPGIISSKQKTLINIGNETKQDAVIRMINFQVYGIHSRSFIFPILERDWEKICGTAEALCDTQLYFNTDAG